MSTDWRALCEELVQLDTEQPSEYADWKQRWKAATKRARAALARPEPEVVGPTDEELLSMDQLRDAWNAQADAANSWDELGADEIIWWAQRQAITRWCRPAPAPDDRGVLPMIVTETGADDEHELERIICASISGGADYVNNMPRELSLERITPDGSTFARYIQADADTHLDVRSAPAPAGEVAELVTWLRDVAASNERIGATQAAVQLTRVADLLEQHQAAPVPVAVSERLPGANDVEAKLRYCWWWNQEQDVWMYGDASHADHSVYTHWLPAHALPLPSGEVAK